MPPPTRFLSPITKPCFASDFAALSSKLSHFHLKCSFMHIFPLRNPPHFLLPFSSLHKRLGGQGTPDTCPACSNFLIQHFPPAFSPFIFQTPCNPNTIASLSKAKKTSRALSSLNYTTGILKYKLQPLKYHLLSTYNSYMNRL